MASPQTEEGYFKLANELWEHLLKVPLLSADLRLVGLVIRKTYGFNRKTAQVSINYAAEFLDLSRSTISKSKRRLLDSCILVASGQDLGVQKDWERWKYTNPLGGRSQQKAARAEPPPPERSSSPSGAAPPIPSGDTDSTRAEPPNKDRKTISKDSIARSRARTRAEPPQGDLSLHQQIVDLFDVFRTTVNPTIQFGHKTNRSAAETLIKKYGADEAVRVAQYATSVQGQKYAPVITTPHELLMKLGQLGVYLKREQGSKPSVLTL